MNFFKRMLFGNRGGLSFAELRKMTYRNKFSDFLPYIAYDAEKNIYFNTDNTIGFLWECTPLVYAGEDIFSTLHGLFTASIPDDSVLQFMLYADQDINPALNGYKNIRTNKNKVIEKTTAQVCDFLKKGANQGHKNIKNTPLRRFRLFVSLKMPPQKKNSLDLNNTAWADIRELVEEILRGAFLQPVKVEPDILINMLLKLFNDNCPNYTSYDPTKTIRNQVILGETPINSFFDRIEAGNKVFRCLTVKKFPELASPLLMNLLTGDILGPQSDTNQLTRPFFITVNLIYQSLKVKLHSKCNILLQQQAVGSFAPSLLRKKEEYTWAAGELERGSSFIRVMPIVWTIGSDEDTARESLLRIRRLWEFQGFVMQEDKLINKILFLSSLPFGLFNVNKNPDYIDRDFIMDADSAAYCLPIQADFAGSGDPCNLFIGRKGQIISIDLFDPRANNNNALICAESGSGKSVLTNYIVSNYYAINSMIRIIDIGGSYKKLCKILGGKFINFTQDSGIVLNPFTNIINIDEDVSSISAIISQMVYSATKEISGETEATIIKNAIRYAYENYGNEADIDSVYEYLTNFAKYADEILDFRCDDNPECVADLTLLSSKLAFNLREFTSHGVYGKWFNGPATLNISKDDFVVLELEKLKSQDDLFNVVTLQLLNYVTQDLYMSDRTRKRLIIFDEAWQFFREGSMLKNVIEEGYRRARKYGGSFTTITQSLLDIEMFGDIGNVLKENSAYKFYLESSAFGKASDKKIIDYEDFLLQILKSVKSPKPKYSEIFMDTPAGVGVARLLLDPFSYYLYTSNADENILIEKIVASGKTYIQALNMLAGQTEETRHQEKKDDNQNHV